MRWSHFVIISCLGVGATDIAQAAPQFTVGDMPSFFQGSFGTNSTLNIFYNDTYFQYQNSTLRFKLEVPYLSVSGLPNGASLSGGSVVSRKGASTQTHSASGIGDVWLSAHYTALQSSGLMPAIVPFAKIKFGTASASQGLGTGRNDYEIGMGLDETIGTRIFPFAHIAYRFVGNPPGYNLQNIWTYNIGSSYLVDEHNVLTGMFDGAQSEQPGYSGPADLVVAWNYNVTHAGSGFQLYFDKGLSNGSPDFGIGIGGQVVF
ncbi:hypothetical protein HAQ01_07075 [Acidithiobacillus thiooxidans]|uniref:hypothetical protein n=1 Tax=Acidithiobacillus TaxID=119977 RepID=UPI0029BFE298|nr:MULTISPECIES: hypothetical protein [Acidithiobacillus]MBU2743269.1 hypothetical protein [Acidithiobacillus albertensis]MBU2793150.1 hypothetical protein [Acidithiobacillus thiooxidans]